MSMKDLLKQVYAIHSTKVRALEEEVKELKEKVQEKERKILEAEINCKRCFELEEAFKKCKAALHEQTKWFGSLGQKFSAFNNFKETDSEKKLLDEPGDENRKLFSDGEIPKTGINAESNENEETKRCIINSKGNLLKNGMIEDDCQGSFDLCTFPFPQQIMRENSSLKPDSAILVPDSLDILKNVKSDGTKSKGDKLHPTKKSVSIVNSDSVTLCNSKENIFKVPSATTSAKDYQNTKMSKKRSCSDSSYLNKNSKRCNVDNEVECTFGEAKNAAKDMSVCEDKNCHLKAGGSVITSDSKAANEDFVITHVTKSKKDNVPFLDIVIDEDNSILNSEKNNTPKNIENDLLGLSSVIKIKEVPFHTSPSLLPLANNPVESKVKELIGIPNDDDFQMSAVNSKFSENGGKWDTCDKKKLSKKSKTSKTVKFTSKFKMTLDAPPLNCKKPSYRQTKLSKSLFESKTFKNTPKENPLVITRKENEHCIVNDINDTSIFFLDDFQTSTPVDTKSDTYAVDFDATCIPENFNCEMALCNKNSTNEGISSESKDKDCANVTNVNLIKSSPVKMWQVQSVSINNTTGSKINAAKREKELKLMDEASRDENLNSFDRLPIPDEPKYKYKEEPVRKKSQRRKLAAFDCKECEKYYSELGLSEKEKQQRMKKCSRHRAKFAPPPTPENYWELGLPDTAECKARGYLNETLEVKLESINRCLPL